MKQYKNMSLLLVVLSYSGISQAMGGRIRPVVQRTMQNPAISQQTRNISGAEFADMATMAGIIAALYTPGIIGTKVEIEMLKNIRAKAAENDYPLSPLIPSNKYFALQKGVMLGGYPAIVALSSGEPLSFFGTSALAAAIDSGVGIAKNYNELKKINEFNQKIAEEKAISKNAIENPIFKNTGGAFQLKGVPSENRLSKGSNNIKAKEFNDPRVDELD